MRNWLRKRKKKLLCLDQRVSVAQGRATAHILTPVSGGARTNTLSETVENHKKPY